MHSTSGIINKQHDELLQMMAEMRNLVTTPETDYLLIPKFGKLLMYLEHHFEYENSAMKRADYFDYDDHSAIHAHLLGLLNIMYRKATRDPATLKQNLPIVSTALTSHIELETMIFRTELLPALRSKAHLGIFVNAQDLRHAPKAGILPYYFNGEGIAKMLFMQPSNPKYGGSSLQIAKGGIGPDEDELTAALREGNEELGLRADNVVHTALVTSETVSGLDETYKLTVFLAQIKDPAAFDTPHYETKRSVWLSQADYANSGRCSQQSIVNKAFSMLK